MHPTLYPVCMQFGGSLVWTLRSRAEPGAFYFVLRYIGQRRLEISCRWFVSSAAQSRTVSGGHVARPGSSASRAVPTGHVVEPLAPTLGNTSRLPPASARPSSRIWSLRRLSGTPCPRFGLFRVAGARGALGHSWSAAPREPRRSSLAAVSTRNSSASFTTVPAFEACTISTTVATSRRGSARMYRSRSLCGPRTPALARPGGRVGAVPVRVSAGGAALPDGGAAVGVVGRDATRVGKVVDFARADALGVCAVRGVACGPGGAGGGPGDARVVVSRPAPGGVRRVHAERAGRGDEPGGVRSARRVTWPSCFPPGSPDGAGGGGDARGVRVAGGPRMPNRRRHRSRRCCLGCPRACWCLPTGATAASRSGGGRPAPAQTCSGA